MNYRQFGNLDFQASILGFGCMRLPLLDNDSSKINEPEAISLIRYAIDNGVNYVDTAYPYHQGQSELVVGKALQNGYRKKTKLATKLPLFLCQSYEDFDRFLNEQLKKLATDHIDFYLLHALNRNTWEKAKKLNVIHFLEKALADGRIHSVGFSFHDELPFFKDIIDYYPWAFCQIQYNYMDTEFQAGTEGLNYATEKGIAVIVMEPLKGGKLAKEPPQSILQLWDQAKAKVKRTPAEWALRWVWNQPQVSLLLSGMGTMEQLEENLRLADSAEPNTLTNDELSLIEEVKKQYRTLTKVDCTTCEYCLPCPSGVYIPRNFALYNDAYIYDDITSSRISYHTFLTEDKRASACIECGTCEEACPQQIPIRKHLKEIQKVFEA